MLPWAIRSICAFACCLPIAGIANAAHPFSFTEAWITVSDRIEVKLRLFTDDIIRYDIGDEPLPETLAASEFNDTVKRQTRVLSDRLQIFDQGRVLVGKVVSSPDPWSTTDVVDVTGAANVKHTWTLEFPLPKVSVRSLTLRHSFSPPGLEQPGELRLHSRHKPWKQRIDAVIPPQMSYTLVFDQQGRSATKTEKANEAVSRIIVSPFAVTHELTMPVEKAVFAFPLPKSASISDNVPAQTASPTASRRALAETNQLSVQQQQVLGNAISDWLERKSSITLNGTSLSKQTKPVVQYFESGIIPEQPLPGSQPTAVAVPGTLVGVRRTFAVSSGNRQGSHEGELSIESDFPGISQFRCETISGDSATTSIQTVPAPLSSRQALHSWTAASAPSSLTSISVAPSSVSQNLVTTTVVNNRGWSWLLLISGITVTMIAGLRHARRRAARSLLATSAITGIGLILIAISFVTGSRVTHQVHTDGVREWMSVALKQIYVSLESPSEQRAVEQLGRWLDEDLVETTWLSLCQQMAADSDQQTWTGIQSVQVTALDCNDLVQPDLVELRCQWEVSGRAFHWGHAHQVIRRFSADLQLSQTSSEWKIAKLDQLIAESATTEAN